MPFRSVAAWLPLALVAICAGCRTPAVGPLTPAVVPCVTHYAGSPLSGPTGQALVLDQRPEDVPSVSVTAVTLDRMPPDAGEPLGSEARLVVAQAGDSAIQPSGRLTQGARVLQGADAPKAWHALAKGRVPLSMDGVLPSGVTAEFRLSDPAQLQDPATGRAVHRGVSLQLAEPTGDSADHHLLASLTVDDLARAAPAAFESEAALFDVPAPDGKASVALFVPFRVRGTPTRAVAILAQVRAGTADAAHLAAVARCQDEVAGPSAGTGQPGHPVPTTGPGPVTLSTALALMDVPVRRRAALAFLAGQTGAALSRDLALTADDALLGKLAAAVKAKVTADFGDRVAAGWQMEQAVLQVLVQMSARGPLPPEVTAVLTSHYGEAGRHAESLDEIAGQMASPARFEAGVVAENMISLEDDAPGSRVRAFEWLQARRHAPAGYDPLGPARERRAALEHAQEPQPEASPTGGQP